MHRTLLLKINQNPGPNIGGGNSSTVSPGDASLGSTQCSTAKPAPTPHMSLQIPKFNMNFMHMTHLLKINQNSVSMCFVEEMQF